MPAGQPSEKRRRFVASANRRVNFVIVEIGKLGKLATPNHEYDQKDIDSIISVLEDELAKLRRVLEAHGKSEPEPITVIEE